MMQRQQITGRQSIILWIGVAIVTGFNLFAALRHEPSTTYLALVLTGSLAVFAVALGIWGALAIRKPRS